MVKKILFTVILFLSMNNLYGYEYMVEPCDDGSFWNIMAGMDPWGGLVFGVTNYTSQGTGAVRLTINEEGDWSASVLRRFGPTRFQGSYATSIADIKSIKMDIYNPSGTNITFRLYVITSWDTSKWQYSTTETAFSNQWTTLEFDLTQNNWNPRGIGDWPDAGSWDQYLHGRENVEEIRLEVFKNDGDNSGFSNQLFILDNIRFTVDDSSVIDFENYEDKTMNNGSKKTVPAGSSLTNYIINNAYQGTQALQIDYSIAANTNGIIWLPQLCRNFTNAKWFSIVARGTGNIRLMLSESVEPPSGITSDGDVWASTTVNVSNSDWDTFYISMNSFTKYSGGGSGTKNLSYITNIGIMIGTGSGSVVIDKLKIQTNDYLENKIVGIFPAPGSLFTNSYNKCKIYLESGFDYNNFKIIINDSEFTKSSNNITIDTNAQYILISNLEQFDAYEILKFKIIDNSGLNYSWMYYKKQTYLYEYSIIDNFESYDSDSDVTSVWSGANSDGSSISISKGDISYEGNNSLKLSYSIASNGWVNAGRDVPLINISQYQYIEFYAKGYGNVLIGLQEDLSGSVNLDGEVWASSLYPVSSAWQKYVIPLDSLTVTGSSSKGGVFDKSKIRWIEFDFNQRTYGTNRTAYIDYIKLVKSEKEFKLLSYIVPMSNEIFLLFNGRLNETSDSLVKKIYELNNALNIGKLIVEDNTGRNTGGVRIKLNTALQNNKIYTLYLDNIEDENGRRFSGKIYILNLNAVYQSGDAIPGSGGTMQYNDLYLMVDEGSFSSSEVITISKINYSINKNYTPVSDIYCISFNDTPKKDIKLILPYFKIDDEKYNQDNFKVAYFDGVNWIPLNSEVNVYGKYVIADIHKPGNYSIIEYTQTDNGGTILSYDDVKVYPDIFTPNNDGVNDEVTFSYYLNKPSYVTIKVFTITGKLVKEVLAHSYKNKGFHSDVTWDGTTDGIKLKRGVYLYKVETTAADNSNIKDVIIKPITIFR